MRCSLSPIVTALCFQFAAMSFVNAVQSSGGQSASTTTWAPGSLTAWDTVGSIGSASGVYLGNYGGEHWVITAAHVGTNGFTLNGTAYSTVAGSRVDIAGEPGATGMVDLILFRITSSDNTALDYLNALGNLDFATEPLATGTDVRLIGHGDNNSQAVIKSWGDNVISGKDSFLVGNNYESVCYYTYDSNGVSAVVGDSGGGMFYWTGDTWALGGIMSGAGDLDELGRGMVAVALDVYADQILGVIPEPGTWAASVGLLAFCAAVGTRRLRRYV